ncbi:MAG: hypothetical protein HYW91_02705 [Candidatus Sungbacteria bacterium]|nr:hypothetical protein [Candidatus Sungbacteria bacterium]
MKGLPYFLKINVLLFLTLNVLSYAVSSVLLNTFFVPFQEFLFPYLPYVLYTSGLKPLAVFILISWSLWLYLCFWLGGEITEELGTMFFQAFILITAVAATIVISLSGIPTTYLLALRDIWIGFWLASILNAEKGESYHSEMEQAGETNIG